MDTYPAPGLTIYLIEPKTGRPVFQVTCAHCKVTESIAGLIGDKTANKALKSAGWWMFPYAAVPGWSCPACSTFLESVG